MLASANEMVTRLFVLVRNQGARTSTVYPMLSGLDFAADPGRHRGQALPALPA
jgi:hypothetical protein